MAKKKIQQERVSPVRVGDAEAQSLSKFVAVGDVEREPEYRVTVAFPTDMHSRHAVDAMIKKAAGALSHLGSGVLLAPPAIRDHDFSAKTLKSALAAAARIKKLGPKVEGLRVHVSVELHVRVEVQ